MAESTTGTTVPVQATQDPAIPTGEQKTPAGQTVEPAVSTQVPQEAIQQPTDQGLPEEASDRTRREFEKLREELRQERTFRQQNQYTFDNLAKPQVQVPEPTPLYDPTTGLLNEKVFAETQRTAHEAGVRAERAERELESLKKERVMSEDEAQRREAIAVYPELDSESPKTFSKDLHVEVRRILQDSILNPQDYNLKSNKSLSYKEAADIARGKVAQVADQAREAGAAQAMENLTPKEQASLEATGTPARREEVNDDLDELRMATRKGGAGSEDAIIARMRKIPATKIG